MKNQKQICSLPSCHSIRGLLVEEFVANNLTAKEIADKYNVSLVLVIDYIAAYHESSPVQITFNIDNSSTLHDYLKPVIRNYLVSKIMATNSIKMAAKEAGFSRAQFYILLHEHNINPKHFRRFS